MANKLPPELAKKKEATLETLRQRRLPFMTHWKELSDMYLPRRYIWLMPVGEQSRVISKNSYILDPSGTKAARTLASGMMNGITSPARPWFRLRVDGQFEDDSAVQIWLEECARRMLLVIAESNFYNAIAVMYMDLAVFGTAAMLVYEDYDSVIHCFTPALGEYFLGQNERLQVNTFGREFQYTVQQIVDRWGIENCSEHVKTRYNLGGPAHHETVTICHLVEPNSKREGKIPEKFETREYYWEKGKLAEGQFLACSGYHEIPGIFPRWEVLGNDAYGSNCPGMDALPDVIQLQHETKKKAQSLDKLVSPPVLADAQLAHKPTSLLPGGITYIAGFDNGKVGAKPIYTVNPPLGEMSQDIINLQTSIRETFHNPLFNMISQLDTVRSAAEIDARREEKLIMLGPVLERFENEALDPFIRRTFGIMLRGGLLPEVPQQLAEVDIEIQYVSILSSAQSAVSTAPIERILQIIGNLAGVVPDVLDVPNWDELMLGYARDIGVPAKGVNSRETIAARRKARQAPAETQQMIEGAPQVAQAAKTLSETQVGGGRSVLSELLG